MSNLPETQYHYRHEYASAKRVCKCAYCDEDINEGDSAYRFDNDTLIHDNCLIEYCNRFLITAGDEYD